ncbi:hypothetical protein Fmac_026627 [Flemingia macrophylla]|uniref:Uncharacterized protein n=1 Tax=Flemingia macrophylla TaxID=520843 RepID=A0ABD1LFZ6_9FABA
MRIVYSTIDKDTLHVKLVDEVVFINESTSSLMIRVLSQDAGRIDSLVRVPPIEGRGRKQDMVIYRSLSWYSWKLGVDQSWMH